MAGRAALVTGGSKGIGLAIARGLAESGVRVAVAARGREGVERAAAELGGGAIGIAADVRLREDCGRAVAEAASAFGRLDILINNAGVGAFGPVADMDPDDWDRVIETNLNGVFYCTHAVIPHLRAAGGGWIINIGSLAGKYAAPGRSAYNATKFGLIGFTEALMQEVRHDGIRVSCIMPGSVATDFRSRGSEDEEAWMIQPADIAGIVLDLLRTPERTLPSRIEVRPSRPPRK